MVLNLVYQPADCHAAMGAGPEAYRRAMASAAMVDELHEELRVVLLNHRFTDAVRASVQHTFRAVAAQLFAAFPSAAPLAPDATGPSSAPASDPSAAGAPAPGAVAAGAASSNATPTTNVPASGSSNSSSNKDIPTVASSQGILSKTWSQTRLSFPQLPSLGLPSRSRNTSQQLLSQNSSSLPASPAANKPPKPLARLLKLVQTSAEPAFENTQKLSKVG